MVVVSFVIHFLSWPGSNQNLLEPHPVLVCIVRSWPGAGHRESGQRLLIGEMNKGLDEPSESLQQSRRAGHNDHAILGASRGSALLPRSASLLVC